MKTIGLLCSLLLIASIGHSQLLKRLSERAKATMESAVGNKIDQKVNDAVNTKIKIRKKSKDSNGSSSADSNSSGSTGTNSSSTSTAKNDKVEEAAVDVSAPSNMQTAEGAAAAKDKLLSEGKYSTADLLFEANSATIEPATEYVLRDIATALKEHTEMRIKIIAHTDTDGDASVNVELSKKRAAAVQKLLISKFGIEAKRMETDGKGGSEPVDSNDNETGKANNRRVEFIKL